MTIKDIAVTIVYSPPPPSMAGPAPLPSPYPIQPGFTAISDVAQITAPGTYQLTADYSGVAKAAGLSDSTIDGAGHNVATLWVENCRNVVLKNFRAASLVTTTGDFPHVTITNSWFTGNGAAALANIWGSGLTISNCAFDDEGGDDDLITVGTLSNLTFLNNTFANNWDAGIEGLGSWDHCVFRGNMFTSTNYAMGGWFNADETDQTFTLTNCIFDNNYAASGVNYMFVFRGGPANDDATATSIWGGAGNAFTNNHR